MSVRINRRGASILGACLLTAAAAGWAIAGPGEPLRAAPAGVAQTAAAGAVQGAAVGAVQRAPAGAVRGAAAGVARSAPAGTVRGAAAGTVIQDGPGLGALRDDPCPLIDCAPGDQACLQTAFHSVMGCVQDGRVRGLPGCDDCQAPRGQTVFRSHGGGVVLYGAVGPTPSPDSGRFVRAVARTVESRP
jgi:hypothetical protein